MHKVKSGTLTGGTVKSNFNETIERFVVRDNAFSFMNSVKGTQHTGKSFYMMFQLWLSNQGDPHIF